ncbi:Uncharacterised protein [Mesomycoplasma conjunctivae]|nr:Uncharacterised protein [Mesomycoplasma conjunctivae]
MGKISFFWWLSIVIYLVLGVIFSILAIWNISLILGWLFSILSFLWSWINYKKIYKKILSLLSKKANKSKWGLYTLVWFYFFLVMVIHVGIIIGLLYINKIFNNNITSFQNSLSPINLYTFLMGYTFFPIILMIENWKSRKE